MSRRFTISRRRRRTLGVALATMLGLALTLLIGSAGDTQAQTLDLGGVPVGPVLSEKCGAANLADLSEAEASALTARARTLSGEASAGARASARVRMMAVYLLRAGATRSWNESALTVTGARLELLVGHIDDLIRAAVAGTTMDGRPLSTPDAKRAITLLEAIAATPSEPMRKACIAPPERLAAECVAALSTMLAPLTALTELLEGTRHDDPWPIFVDARATQPDRLPPSRTASEILVTITALPSDREKLPLRAALQALIDRGASAAADLRLIDGAAEAVAWLTGVRALGAPAPMSDIAISAALDRICAAAAVLGRAGLPAATTTTNGAENSSAAELAAQAAESALNEARATLEALPTTVAAARAMLTMRATNGISDASRAGLSDAMASLLAPEAGGAPGERERSRTASRIIEACATAARLEQSLVATAPRDMKDVLRQLDKDARFAVRALPMAFKAIAANPAAASEPGNLSALERVRTIEADRQRIVLLQDVIDAVGAIRPGAGRDFAVVGKRMAKLLLDPLKRSEGQTAFSALESQYLRAFPFAFEDELKRRDRRAVELCDGTPELVAQAAAALRASWCDAIGTGDLGGNASARLDQAARLCRALRDLDQVIEPISRAKGDTLATWGGWAMRRAMIAPATQDLTARAKLATRSFVASVPSIGGGQSGSSSTAASERNATFLRDLTALETAIPIVKLTAGLERRVAPLLRGDPGTLGTELGALLTVPAGNAYLVDEWPRLLSLNRMLFEAEFARRSGNAAMVRELEAYGGALAREIEQAAFGAPRVVARVPGFDGTSVSAPVTNSGGRRR